MSQNTPGLVRASSISPCFKALAARVSLYVSAGAAVLLMAAAAGGPQQSTRPNESDHSSVLPSRPSTEAPTSSHLDVLGSDRRLDTLSGSLPVRTIDGLGNNRANPDWGRAGTTLLRVRAIDYSDGIGVPAAPERPSEREISNLCAQQDGSIPNSNGVSSFVWQWGQFVDHDIDLVAVMEPREAMEIAVPSAMVFSTPRVRGTSRLASNVPAIERWQGYVSRSTRSPRSPTPRTSTVPMRNAREPFVRSTAVDASRRAPGIFFPSTAADSRMRPRVTTRFFSRGRFPRRRASRARRDAYVIRTRAQLVGAPHPRGRADAPGRRGLRTRANDGSRRNAGDHVS